MARGLQRRLAQEASPSGRWLLALSDEQLTQLVKAAAVVSFRAGERLLVAGEPAGLKRPLPCLTTPPHLPPWAI